MIRRLLLLIWLCVYALCFEVWAGEPSLIREGFVGDSEFGDSVFVREAGDDQKQTVILVHGLGSAASDDWLNVIPVLASKYHVLAIDLPGFGRSAKGNHLYSPTRYARCVKGVLERYTKRNKQSIIMVGHSLGGGVALRYASLYPEMLERLILVDVAGILQRSAFTRASMHIDDDGDGKIRKLNRWLGDLIIATENLPMPINTILASKSLRHIILRDNSAMIAGLALLQEDFGEDIRAVQAPTSIIWGEEDSVAPLRTGRVLEARIARSHLELIKDTGHVPMVESPAEFNRVLLAELQRTDYRAASGAVAQDDDRYAVCEKKAYAHFSGHFKSISIKSCKQVVMEDVVAEKIEIVRSNVEIMRGHITTDETGMRIHRSRVMATALDIQAKVGVNASASELDFAGVDIRARKAAIMTSKRCKLIFSVSEVQSLYSAGARHGVYAVRQKSPL